ncbi:MAG TPA: tetratricopeptide repeat protein, partial [Chloroflexota bacterium]
SGWLLVIDNADDPALLGTPDGTGWVRRIRQGLVMITTRNGDESCWPEADMIPVGVLAPEASADVLMDLAPAAGGREDALALAARLGYLPLALRLSGMHLRQEFTSWRSFEEYRNALESKGVVPVIGASEKPDPRMVVTRTWEMSLDALGSAGLPQARPLLWLLSCYAPGARIPEEMITSGGLVASSSRLLSALLDVDREVSAEEWADLCLSGFRGLRSVGLIWRSDATDGPRAIELHPFIAEVTRAVMEADNGRAGIEPSVVRECAATTLTTTAAALDTGDAEHWPYFQHLTPHVLDMLTHAAPHLGTGRQRGLLNCMVLCIASYMWSRAESRAEQLASTALELALGLGDDHKAHYLRLHHALAWSLREQGRLTEAEALFKKVLSEQLAMPDGAMRADALLTSHDLAWTVGRSGRWHEAEEQFRDVLQRRRDLRRQHGQEGDDSDIMHTRCMMCWSVGKQGRWSEAERGYRSLAADRAALLGLEHADTLDTWENIGKALAWQGRWADAESVWRWLAERRERTLGEKHPDTLRACQIAAYATGFLARNRSGRRNAITALERIHKIQIYARGKDHKETQETLALLAELRGKRLTDLLWPEDLPQPEGL